MVQALQCNSILEQAQKARSIKGAPLPQTLVNKLVALAKENPNYRFIIGSSGTLSRKKSFFRQNCLTLTFYNKSGEEFEFSDYAEAIKFNELFMAIDFGKNTQEAYIYVYFPYDGAFR